MEGSKEYWDQYNKNLAEAAGFKISSGLGGVPEYWDYEDGLQKNALRKAFRDIGIGKGDSVLEVGCGNGRLALWFSERGLRVWGIDVSPSAIENATTVFSGGALDPARFLVYDGVHFPFDDNSFDVVNMTAVLPILEEEGLTATAVSEMVRVCRPGGNILLLELISKKPKEDKRMRIKMISQEALVSLFAAHGARLTVDRGVCLDRVRIYFSRLKRFERAWEVFRRMLPLVLLWSAFVDRFFAPILPAYAEKKLFVFKKNEH